ncbi:SDR family NAD(P)-dependent oxidoreductase [Pseudomonas fluorescens]|uniref:SDR family NAD(P)-dependent oxidoreductase n=1 Tax=Pseudomonas fluorescens TaxID=294 RepID=UPI001BECAA5F|nr:SDR family oxidoreductase [Pseudomonas fluorescens]MBT2372358.1 SDR family oxidoreductase [Pseudomonas fluorescens]
MEHIPITLISGGGRGLGQCLVESRLAAGDIVATFCRHETDFIAQMRAREASSGRFYWEALDATRMDDVVDFVSRVHQKFGRIDHLVNNAGVGVDGLLATSSLADIRYGIELNLMSAIVLTRQCIKSMFINGRGCIINISSINALRGHSGLSVYSATKAALDGFTRSLAKEVGQRNIRVNALAPGYFASDMVGHLDARDVKRIVRRTPLQRLCSLNDLADAVTFLINAKFVTGQTLAVDGGFSC